MSDASLNNRVSRMLIALLCSVALPVAISPDASGQKLPSARATRATSVSDSISAHLVSHKGATILHESGRASGTLSCSSLTIQINISYTHAYVIFNCPTSSGDVSGQGETSFYASGGLAYFHGYLGVGRGTGRYARSGGSRLYIKGTLRRGNYAISASVTGSLRL